MDGQNLSKRRDDAGITAPYLAASNTTLSAVYRNDLDGYLAHARVWKGEGGPQTVYRHHAHSVWEVVQSNELHTNVIDVRRQRA